MFKQYESVYFTEYWQKSKLSVGKIGQATVVAVSLFLVIVALNIVIAILYYATPNNCS